MTTLRRRFLPLLGTLAALSALGTRAHAQPLPTGERIRDLAGPVWFGLRTDQGAPAIDQTIVSRECNAAEFTHYPAWGGWPKRGDNGLPAFIANVDHFDGLGMPMIMHLFAGPDLYLPIWFKDGTWDKQTLDTLLGELVTTTIQEGDPQGRVDVWNVVNEAINWEGTGWETSKLLELGYEPDASGLTGVDHVFDSIPVYVRLAFERARAATNADLELRDYDNDGLETRYGQGVKKARAFYQLVRHLQNTGAPITAVGLQGHFNIDTSVTWSRLTDEVARYRALGLKVFVTELDAQQNDHAMTWDDAIAARQGDYYYQYVKAALAGGANGIFVWGVRDNQDQGWRLGENAVLFAEDGSAKPAYYGVQRAFEEAELLGSSGGATGGAGASAGGANPGAGGMETGLPEGTGARASGAGASSGASGSPSSSGCGCSTAGLAAGWHGPALALVGLVLLGRRRRGHLATG